MSISFKLIGANTLIFSAVAQEACVGVGVFSKLIPGSN